LRVKNTKCTSEINNLDFTYLWKPDTPTSVVLENDCDTGYGKMTWELGYFGEVKESEITYEIKLSTKDEKEEDRKILALTMAGDGSYSYDFKAEEELAPVYDTYANKLIDMKIRASNTDFDGEWSETVPIYFTKTPPAVTVF